MMHFGAFVPNVSWEASESTMTDGCKVTINPRELT